MEQEFIVETDNGHLFTVDPVEAAKWIIVQLKEDKVLKFKEATVWDYIDSANKFYRICPISNKAIGRAFYNQMIYDIVRKNFK